MILKWIQSMGNGAESRAAKEADDEERRTRKESRLVDVAHEALVSRAARDRASLDGLIRFGAPHMEREKLKAKVRRKVWDVVEEGSAPADPSMVEEITERIADAAEADPFYKRLFDREAV